MIVNSNKYLDSRAAHGTHLTPSLSLPESSFHMPTESQISNAVAERLGQEGLEGACVGVPEDTVNISGFQVKVHFRSPITEKHGYPCSK